MSHVEQEEVRFVRLYDDGTVTLTDIEYIPVEGTIAAPGDFFTQIESDGLFYTIQIVERHWIYEPHRKNYYWCLIFRDVEDTSHLKGLTATMLEWSKKADQARASDLKFD
ncbi:hypothetical protein [Pararhizobium sp. PWRC1-1]|uniref:hypothetical protein n=1 Tax=Pararhizobium sp. PWRC1-1 TaxID=2804566 RepID=UPI003CEB8830